MALIELSEVSKLYGFGDATTLALDEVNLNVDAGEFVAVMGPSGSGKEHVAHRIHLQGLRAGKPLVKVNCAAIPPELFESELFGHVRGAYTGAQNAREGLFYYANGGTLFLDEITELPLPMQAKLLRVLEERRIRPVGSEQEIPVDVRIVTAANRSLAEEVSAGRFRRDL